jgi:hypothetical protein
MSQSRGLSQLFAAPSPFDQLAPSQPYSVLGQPHMEAEFDPFALAPDPSVSDTAWAASSALSVSSSDPPSWTGPSALSVSSSDPVGPDTLSEPSSAPPRRAGPAGAGAGGRRRAPAPPPNGSSPAPPQATLASLLIEPDDQPSQTRAPASTSKPEKTRAPASTRPRNGPQRIRPWTRLDPSAPIRRKAAADPPVLPSTTQKRYTVQPLNSRQHYPPEVLEARLEAFFKDMDRGDDRPWRNMAIELLAWYKNKAPSGDVLNPSRKAWPTHGAFHLVRVPGIHLDGLRLGRIEGAEEVVREVLAQLEANKHQQATREAWRQLAEAVDELDRAWGNAKKHAPRPDAQADAAGILLQLSSPRLAPPQTRAAFAPPVQPEPEGPSYLGVPLKNPGTVRLHPSHFRDHHGIKHIVVIEDFDAPGLFKWDTRGATRQRLVEEYAKLRKLCNVYPGLRNAFRMLEDPKTVPLS